jgi:hypothetical protein
MSPTSANPLVKHFRQPAIYLKLPSHGKFYLENTIDLPITGEIPIYPMTVKDELTLKTPDALMNGTSMVDMVTSCCPNIKDPWAIPTCDMDAIFIAIRIASYGPGMDISAECPHCRARNEYTIDLRTVLDRVRSAEIYNYPVKIQNLTFRFKPQAYKDLNQNNIIAFEEQRLVDNIVLNNEMPQEEKVKLFNNSFAKLRDMNLRVVANSIDSITTEEGVIVNDFNMIMEFLDNSGRDTYSTIKDHVAKIIDQVKLEEMQLVCDEEPCGKQFASKLEFDQSNFFA